MAPTLSKSQANYHLAHTTYDRNRYCQDCGMFRRVGSEGDGKCTLVKGDIHPHGTCNHYEAR